MMAVPTMSESIAEGTRVVMHYTLCLADGTVADTSRDGEPMDFQVGDGSLDPGLEGLLAGLRTGDRARFSLAPGQAFGDRDPGNVHPMPREEFPPELALEEGAVVSFSTPGGDEVLGTVLEVGEETVRLDFNHPLAGRQLSVDVEIVSVDRKP